MNHPADSYKVLSIPDKVEEHDLDDIPLTAQPSDDDANVVTEYVCFIF